MRNQNKYLVIYLCVLCLLIGSLVQLAQAQEQEQEQEQTVQSNSEVSEDIELDQASLDQMLAPIALYPDTLLSHILVASTYPLEVIQAARWRTANEDLDEQQALDAVEQKDWDPSVQALVPFNNLLQQLSEDLDWLQSLGSAFLVNEQQILASVQKLRQKAYEQGNLTDNNYVNVEQEDDQIIIETVRKEVIYVPYYDTRVVYGNWWWHNHQPYYWHMPRHSIFHAGLYWSIGFNIRPRFYFGGVHWRNHHVVANYHYRRHANRHWSYGHSGHQVVRVKEYPRWSHNVQHRRGAQYRVNGQKIVRKMHGGKNSTSYQRTDKKRVLNVNYDTKKYDKSNAKHIKQALGKQHTVHQAKTHKAKNLVSNKQRIINHSKNQQRYKQSNDYQPKKISKAHTKPRNSDKSRKYASLGSQNNTEKRSQNKSNTHKSNTYKSSPQNSNKRNSYSANSHKQNKSRPVKIARHAKSSTKHR